MVLVQIKQKYIIHNYILMYTNPNDRAIKRMWLNQNTYESKIGAYKSLRVFRCAKSEYLSKYKPGVTNSICNVSVINQNHIDILEALLEKGPAHLVGPNKPLVLLTVGETFTGAHLESEEGLRDPLFVLRTNFSVACKVNDPFPLKNTECAYIPLVTVIRNKMYNFLPYNNLFSYALIISSPIAKPDKIDDDKMNVKDYMHTLQKIETVFQTAIACGHKILILTPYGLDDDDDNPIEDTIKIFNYCIFKYGHKFDNIILSVPEYFPDSVYKLYRDNLVNPQEITKEVDAKYEISKMHEKLLTK